MLEYKLEDRSESVLHDVQAHMLPNECGDSGHDCRASYSCRRRRRDHAVTRIHDTPLRDLFWLSSTETLVTWTGCRTGLSYQEVECFVVQDKSELTSYVHKDIV